MLPVVEVQPKSLDGYRDIISRELTEEIEGLARRCRGLKVFHVNSTPRGGGVAEILRSLVPLMQAVGVEAQWYTMPPRAEFFEVTKHMHDALQGGPYTFGPPARHTYTDEMVRTADLMQHMDPDVWVIHDPQPAGVIMLMPDIRYAISHLHIDLTLPDVRVWEFVAGFLRRYQKVVVSSSDFVKPELADRTVVFPPAIDLLSPKNQSMPAAQADEILRAFTIDPDRPIVAQVSRFDPYKDPLGVVEAYRIAKREVAGLQLVLVGFLLAQDDPEAVRVYQDVARLVGDDPDAFLFSDVARLGEVSVDVFVSAVQTAADVVLQKSVREGFGMTVTEAMWKSKPVIGGNVGGIKLQIQDGLNGFLVDTPEEAADRTVELLRQPQMAQQMGQRAHQSVGEHFAMPRLLRDYLRLLVEAK